MSNIEYFIAKYGEDARYLSIQEKIKREDAIEEAYYTTLPASAGPLRMLTGDQIIEAAKRVEAAQPPRHKVNEEITWEMLVKHEPRLTLIDDMTDSFLKLQLPEDSAIDFYYGYKAFEGFGAKELISELVGWGSESPVSELHSMKAFDVVTDLVLHAIGLR